jgi:hypothetical protein
VRYKHNTYMCYMTFVLGKAVPWLRRLAAGLKPRKPGVDPADQPKFKLMVNKVRMVEVFPRQYHYTNDPYSSLS